jgi:hypothetical protein
MFGKENGEKEMFSCLRRLSQHTSILITSVNEQGVGVLESCQVQECLRR